MGISSSHSLSLVSSRDESQQLGGMVQKIITSSTVAVLFFLSEYHYNVFCLFSPLR